MIFRNKKTLSKSSSSSFEKRDDETVPIVIVGGGIVGLVLALGIKQQTGIACEIYEQATEFKEDFGAGMGIYPNGMRVLRDISHDLLNDIRAVGRPYLFRRWERHDGTEVVVSKETCLAPQDEELQSIGIRRWRLQKVLFDHAQKEGIVIHFNKRTENVRLLQDPNNSNEEIVQVKFEDGTKRNTQLLFAADGANSQVRSVVTNGKSQLKYTGTTCIMGMASNVPAPSSGICFPSSSTTKCHGVFFPTLDEEQCFQYHFPISDGKIGKTTSWGGKGATVNDQNGTKYCKMLAATLKKDGWHEKYLTPLQNATNVISIGFAVLEPALSKWVYGNNRIVLLGDAAHPPVPYLGQGAQMGIEDAGTIALLMKQFYRTNTNGSIRMEALKQAWKIYEHVRIPRTSEILGNCHKFGATQQKRAECEGYNERREEKMKRDVFFHETLPILFPGATYEYRTALQSDELMKKIMLRVDEEDEEETEKVKALVMTAD